MATRNGARVRRVDGWARAVGRALPITDIPRLGERVDAARAALAEHPRVAAAIGLTTLGLAALALRVLFLGRSFDVFIDEVTYLILSKNVVEGEGVTLSGKPFFLHPPLLFLIEGPFQAALGPARLLLDEVERVRLLNAILAAGTAVLLYAIAAQTAGRRLGLVAFAFFAIDAFVIRMNSRNLLETSALFWVVLGYLCLLLGIRDGHTAMPKRYVLGVGVFFGLALLTKEMTAFLTLLPLGIAFLTGWFTSRRSVFAAGLIVAATYSIYPITIFLTGLGPTYLAQKFEGLLRFLGIMKTTGFVHGSGGPSFIEAIVRNLDAFATTYVLLGLGIPAFLILLASHHRPRRLLGVLGLSAYALLAYSVTLGTLEEQFFYFLVVPAFLSVPVAWASVLGSDPDPAPLVRRFVDRLRPTWLDAIRRVGAAAMAVSIGWSSIVWTEVHLTPDNGYAQLLTWLRREVPFGTTVGVTSEPGEFLIQGYVIDKTVTIEALKETTADYVVVSSKQVDDAYLEDGREMYGWLVTHGQRAFLFEGRTYGRLELFALRDREMLLEADFDGAGAALPPPWSASGSGTAAIAASPSNTIDRALRLSAGGGRQVTACHPLASTGALDLDIREEILLTGSGTGTLLSLRSQGTEVAGLAIDASGGVRASGAETSSGLMRAGVWYGLSAAIDPIAGTFTWAARPTTGTGATLRGNGTLTPLDSPIDAACVAWAAPASNESLMIDDLVIRD